MEAYRDLQPIEDDLDAKIGERLKTIPGVQAIEFGLSDFVPLDNGKISHLARGWQSVPEEFRFLSGRKFDKDERGVALLGARLARSLDKKVGDQITVQDHLGEDASLKVIGIFESPTSANGFFQAAENSSVIMPLRELQRIKNRIGAVTQFWILVDNADAERVKSVKDAIEGLRDEKGNSLRLTARSLPASSSLLAPKECDGLPEGIWGRIAVGVARSNSQRIYALIEAEKGGLFRSDDGGDTWELVNSGRGLRQRAWYFTTLTIHPKNADIVYCPQVPLLKSIDGGKSFGRVKGPHHGDHHDLWIDPKNPERMIDSNDGGVDISTNGGLSWYAPPLPVCQFYHVAADNRVPYWVSGCMQDIGTASGPSNSLGSEGILLSNWHNVGGGETGFTAPDPADPNILYAGEYMGYVTRYDHRTRQARSIGIYPYNASGHAAADLKYRFQWTAPLMISPHDPKVVYHAANVLFRTSDAGLKWEVISPDMTRNDKSKQKWSGGPITGDNTGVEVYDTIFAIAESPKQKGLLWAGSDDGLVHVSDNGGKDWKRVTPPKMPEWGTVICIEPSPFQPLAAFVVVDCHKLDDNRPHLFHTTDAGKTWKDAVGDLPKDVYLRAVRHDPKQPGLLYLGTSAGVFFSANSGKNWRPLKLNLPAVQVCDLVVKDNDLVVGTDGRSLWILDDLTPIRTWSETIAGKQLHLFEPAPAYRYRYHSVLQEGLERGSADNPPQGAILHYFLKTKPKGDVVIEVFDQKDKLVRKLSSKEEPREPAEEGDYSEAKEPKPLPAEAGLQRVVWDLRYSGAATIKKAKTDGGNPKIGPLVLPGSYTIKLTVEGKTLTTKVEVKQDPRETVPDRVLAEQLSLILAMRDDISKVTKTVEQLRSVRKQITEQSKLLKDHEGSTALAAAGKKVLAKLDALEEKLHNPRAKISYDILAQKGGAQLYSQLAWLYEQLKDSDGPVGEGMNNVYAGQHALLETYQTQWRELLGGEVTRAAEQIRAMGGGIVLPAQKKSMDSASGEK